MDTNANQKVASRGSPWAIWGVLFLLLVIGGCIWAYYSLRSSSAVVTERTIVGSVTMSGEAVAPPSARADVMPPYRATVDRVLTSVGSKVGRGDVLVVLAFPSVQAAVDQARSAVRTAETNYANAQRQYDGPVAAARQRLSAARTSENNVRFEPGQPPVETTSPDQASHAASEQADAQSALSQAIADRDAALLPYKLQLDTARATYSEAKAGARSAQIRAPIKGTVLVLNARPGQEIGVDAKVPVARIVNLDALQVQGSLPPAELGHAKPGTEVSLFFSDWPRSEYKGKVSRIVSQVVSKLAGLRKDEQYVALIDFKNENGSVRPGMKADAAIKTGEVENALAVPNGAIGADRSGRPTVNVLQNGNWRTVVVETGVSDGRFVEVKSGLSKGETVQVKPNLLYAASFGKR